MSADGYGFWSMPALDPKRFTARQLIRLHEMLNSACHEDQAFAHFLLRHFDTREDCRDAE